MSAFQDPRPVQPSRSAGTAALAADGPFAAVQPGGPGCTPEAASALAELRLAQMRALRHRFRNDLQSMCSLASFHARRADGLASEAGFAGIGRRAIALAALYEELLRGDGEDAVNFASYLAALCGRLAAAGSPAGTRFALHDASNAAPGTAPAMDRHTASALGTVVSELAAAVAGIGRAGIGRAGIGRAGSGQAGNGQAGNGRAGNGWAGAGPHVLVQLLPHDGRGRGRLTVSMAAPPDGVDGLRPRDGYDLGLARSLVAQAGGELDRLVCCTGAGWCVRF